MWNLMIVESLHRRPLILVGRGWQSTFDQFFRELGSYMTAPQREILHFADGGSASDRAATSIPESSPRWSTADASCSPSPVTSEWRYPVRA